MSLKCVDPSAQQRFSNSNRAFRTQFLAAEASYTMIRIVCRRMVLVDTSNIYYLSDPIKNATILIKAMAKPMIPKNANRST